MNHLVWIGDGGPPSGTLDSPPAERRTVTWLRRVASQDEIRRLDADLVVAEIDGEAAAGRLEAAIAEIDAPWIACVEGVDPEKWNACFRAGATAVIPRGASAALRRAIDTLLRTPSRCAPDRPAAGTLPRPAKVYRAGDAVRLAEESVLEVVAGIVAVTVLHTDGEEVLLALLGPGETLPGHPGDACCIQLRAHTAARVTVRPWSELAGQVALAESLRHRLRQMEAWAAVQARPLLADRLLGLFGLLAGSLGKRAATGVLLDVRLTHAQLASAIGATRSTVTRQLGRLRLAGLVRTTGRGAQERFLLSADVAELHGERAKLWHESDSIVLRRSQR